jgi:mRNA-degrading endonuclease RelE of RelBE toxin-antitoxin system
MRLLITATFVKVTKKLRASQKVELDTVLKLICKNPLIGEAKLGDVSGVYVYKFRLSQKQCLLAYRVLDSENIKLLTFGPHENFYRDLKRQGE